MSGYFFLQMMMWFKKAPCLLGRMKFSVMAYTFKNRMDNGRNIAFRGLILFNLDSTDESA
jgi:hypothetical protein